VEKFNFSLKRLKIFLLATAALVAVMSLWAFWWEPASLHIIQECVAVKWTAPRPLRAALLTDLHVGSPFNGVDRLHEIVKRTNAAAPDVVFILGDLVVQGVVGGSFVAPEDIARELGRLRAPSGIFAVLGNHDVWLGAQRVQTALTSVGIVVLEDQAVNVETPAGIIRVAGVGDMWTRPHNVRAATRGASDSQFPLLVLTHNPDIFPEIPPSVTLTLAGHTHGGQVRLPLIGAPVVPSRYGQRFAAGHIIEGGRHLYVATGIGTSILPVRFGVPPSIVVLTIGSACT
jgi:uncharacterized protein